jgi:hypothetical protein
MYLEDMLPTWPYGNGDTKSTHNRTLCSHLLRDLHPVLFAWRRIQIRAGVRAGLLFAPEQLQLHAYAGTSSY